MNGKSHYALLTERNYGYSISLNRV